MAWPWNQGSFKVIGNRSQTSSWRFIVTATQPVFGASQRSRFACELTCWARCRNLFVCMSVCMALSYIISEIKWDIGRKSRFAYTPAFDAPVRGSPSKYRHKVWYVKTRMVRLLDGKKVRVYVYSLRCNTRTWQTPNRPDRQTDIARRHRPSLCIASRGRIRII